MEVQEFLVLLRPRYVRWMENPDPDFLMRLARTGELCLSDVQNQRPELCLEVVRQDPKQISWVQEQTEEVCMAAIRRDGCAIFSVKNPTEEMWLEAVRQEPSLIMDVNIEPSSDYFHKAVRLNPRAFMFLEKKKQTPELCLWVVQRVPRLLGSVQEQTFEVCRAAVDVCLEKCPADFADVVLMVNPRFSVRISRYIIQKMGTL